MTDKQKKEIIDGYNHTLDTESIVARIRLWGKGVRLGIMLTLHNLGYCPIYDDKTRKMIDIVEDEENDSTFV